MENLNGAFEVADVAADTKKAEKKEFLNSIKAEMREVIATDPSYVDRLQSLSGALEVVHTLGYGVGGNIMLDKTSATRTLKQTATIKGYEVRNIGTEPITYSTEVWTQGEDGLYTAQTVEKVMNPGDVVALTRKWLAVLCCRPEFSFVLANGKIISSIKKDKPIEQMLESFYFQFNNDSDVSVNDDSVKKSIDEATADGGRAIKAEYLEAFGFLANPEKAKAKKAKAAGGKQLSVQDMVAFYVNKELNK